MKVLFVEPRTTIHGPWTKASGDAENDDVTLADRFRDMREDWRQLRIQRIEDAEERKAERKAARNGVTFESVSH